MSDKEQIYPDGYPRQRENFSEEQKFKFDVFGIITDLALKTTEKAFERLGYKKSENTAGVYSDGTKLGAGTDINHFNIKISSKSLTNTYFEKIIYFGGKETISIANIGWNTKNKIVEITYKTSESGFFRGYGSQEGPHMLNQKETFVIDSISDFKTKLEKLFSNYADKEVAHITKTKLGIEDKTEKSTTSMVENFMKTFSLKQLFNSLSDEVSAMVEGYINETKQGDFKMNNPEIIAANSPGKLLFDDLEELEDGETKTAAKNKLKKFGCVSVKELKPSEKKTFFEELEKELSIKEITAGGGNAAGGAYSTPYAFKPGGDLNIGGGVQRRKFEDTNYAKGKVEKPSIIKTKNENDSFWTSVELNPGSGYVPKGMDKNFVMGKHAENINKINETINKKNTPEIIKESLIKKKFITIEENEEKGINKRYIITQQRSDEEEKSNWKKLAMFETYQTIKKAETISENDKIAEDVKVKLISENTHKDEQNFRKRLDINEGDSIDGRKVILVAKNNSLSNAILKVFEDDFLNESKVYIKDLNSGNIVLNPNCKY